MTLVITDYEMSRRKAIASAQVSVTDAMADHQLTALEWVQVLAVAQQRMVAFGLKEEWTEDTETVKE